MRQRKAAPGFWELTRHAQWVFDVLLLNINNFTEHQLQKRPSCACGGSRQKHDPLLSLFEPRQNMSIAQATQMSQHPLSWPI